MSYQKYGNKSIVVNGIKFQSKLESERYEQLMLLERAGEISGLKLQFGLQINPPWTNPYTGAKLKGSMYYADFFYIDNRNNKMIIEDTKGVETDVFRLKWNLVQSLYPQYEFRKVRREDI